MLAAARQLTHSPWELYGPYDHGHRLVLIHAPLYYRATGLLAWPLYRAGVDPVLATLAAGRALSVAGLLATLAAVFRLGRLRGRRRVCAGSFPPLAKGAQGGVVPAQPVSNAVCEEEARGGGTGVLATEQPGMRESPVTGGATTRPVPLCSGVPGGATTRPVPLCSGVPGGATTRPVPLCSGVPGGATTTPPNPPFARGGKGGCDIGVNARIAHDQVFNTPPLSLAGWWAVLLAAATPIYGGLPFEVRPDLAAVAFQTIGVLLLLSELGAQTPRKRMLLAACVSFAIAVCIKQHFIAVPAVSTGMLLFQWRQGRLRLGVFVGVLLAAVGIVASYYGFEEWATKGLMSRSVFLAAARVGRVHPAGWLAALNIVLAIIWKCVGLILLLAAAGLIAASTRDGARSKPFVGAGAALVGAVALLAVLQFLLLKMWLSVSIVAGLILILAWIIPVYSLPGRRSGAGQSVDRALWAYLAAELLVVAILSKLSTGAWFNYAIQAVVFASVLVARALAFSLERGRSRGPLVAAALAAAAVPAFALTDIEQLLSRRVSERRLTDVLAQLEAAAAGILLRGPPR